MLDEGEGAAEAEELREEIESATKAELVAFIRSVSGARVPEIFKVAAQHGNVVERTPPYRPELQPIEYLWAHMKRSYATRYDGAGVAAFLESFFQSISEQELLRTARHADEAAVRMSEPAAALLLDDDVAPGGAGGEEEAANWSADEGEMWGW